MQSSRKQLWYRTAGRSRFCCGVCRRCLSRLGRNRFDVRGRSRRRSRLQCRRTLAAVLPEPRGLHRCRSWLGRGLTRPFAGLEAAWLAAVGLAGTAAPGSPRCRPKFDEQPPLERGIAGRCLLLGDALQRILGVLRMVAGSAPTQCPPSSPIPELPVVSFMGSPTFSPAPGRRLPPVPGHG